MADRDLTAGVPLADVLDGGMVAGKVGDADVLLVRTANGVVALDGLCTHVGAKLADGILVGETIRCPWHHACFDAGTGAAIAAPALKALGRWAVEQRDGRIVVTGKRTAETPPPSAIPPAPIVIVGAGGAGAAAAAALVQLGIGAATILIGDEAEPPYDRTMLTKEFLAGKVGDDDISLTMADLPACGVDVRRGVRVAAIEPEGRRIRLSDGTWLPFGRLILATGAEPKRLDVPGADLPHVHRLRAAADARSIIAALPAAPRIAIVGGSFIGFEAAAALRDRGSAVAIISPDPHPFAKVLGPALSEAILAVHRRHGTALHLGRSATRITKDSVILDDGTVVPADLVLVGVGVSPRTQLAEDAGLAVDDGVVVDERLRTSRPDIFAAGDIACWPDPHGGKSIRVEHWAVAQRQGQIAAANAAGHALRYDVVPFFWTLHFDLSIRVVGHATRWDAIETEGELAHGAVLRFIRDGKQVAVATVERDRDALKAEVAMERKLGSPAATLPGG